MIADGIDTVIPTKNVGPVRVRYRDTTYDVDVPLATFETPLWHSVNRGAKISQLCGGIASTVLRNTMTRSVSVMCKDAAEASFVARTVVANIENVKDIIEQTSKYLRFDDLRHEIVGNLIIFRISIIPGEASGHNMVTKASEAFLNWLLDNHKCQYVSLSANMCVDKKVSAINGILGRGKHVVSDIVIHSEICSKVLKSTPTSIHELNISKNLVGSTLAGSIRSANAHYANMLLAIYLATGQDAANIVEGSQGVTYTSITPSGDLYFSVNMPNIIVGTVGNGKSLGFAAKNIELMGCVADSEKLAAIIGATVLCGELSLLAALTNQGELMKAHIALERRHK